MDRGLHGVRVVFVVTSLGVGGTERQLSLLASQLAQRGMSVTVFSLADGAIRTELERAGIAVIVAKGGAFSIFAAGRRLFQEFRQQRPQIAHFFLPAAYLIGAPVAMLAQVRVRVMSRRSRNFYQRNSAVRGIERLFHHLMHALVANSRRVVDDLIGEGASVDRIALIYNGVDALRIPERSSDGRNSVRKQLGVDYDALIMCMVANLISYKGHVDLLDGLAGIRERLAPGWRLLVVGRDDGIGAALQSRAALLGIAGNIAFLGARNDVPAILSASDIGILSSREEGFSNAILEGMLAGLPMVVTDVGGNGEAVVNGVTGTVVPARDAGAMGTAILALATDPILRKRYGAAGRARALCSFNVERFVRSHERLYRALLNGRRPSDVPEIAIAED